MLIKNVSFNPFIPKISFSWYFSSVSAMQFLWFSLWEFGIESTDSFLIDIFLHSHHLSAWYGISIVRRNSLLVTQGRWKVKFEIKNNRGKTRIHQADSIII